MLNIRSGHSKKPLVKKLGIKTGHKVLLLNEPGNYHDLIIHWPDKIRIMESNAIEQLDFVHLFTREKSDLKVQFPLLKAKLEKDGLLWISWPKGKSLLAKDLHENDVREIGLQNGLVDVKVCAVDEDWSGSKFMYRKLDR